MNKLIRLDQEYMDILLSLRWTYYDLFFEDFSNFKIGAVLELEINLDSPIFSASLNCML